MNAATGSVERVRDSRLGTVNIPIGQKCPAKPTSIVGFRCNLMSSCTPSEPNYLEPLSAADLTVDSPYYKTLRPWTYTRVDPSALAVTDIEANRAEFVTEAGGAPKTIGDGTDVVADAASFEDYTQSMMTTNDWATKIDVYDSLGNRYTMETVFRKVVTKPSDPGVPEGAETEWDWYSYYVGADGERLDLSIGGEGAGTLVFGDNGLLKRTYYYDPNQLRNMRDEAATAAAAGGTAPSATYVVPELKEVFIVDGQPRTAATGGDLTVTARMGADFNVQGSQGSVDPTPPPPTYEPNTIQLDFLGYNTGVHLGVDKEPIDGVTQFNSASTTKGYYQDGYTMGVLDNWSVSQTGIITGSYSNGQTIPLAQVALAMFANEGGLLKVGETCFAETVNSGLAQIDGPMTNGAGSVVGNTIEMSNVDLSEEFVNLIRAQRGFQANTRVVTTSDQVLEELINMKR
jgi:flagellar hook protein FlgE